MTGAIMSPAGNSRSAFARFARVRFWRLLPVVAAGAACSVLLARYLPAVRTLGAGGGMLAAYLVLFLAAWYACRAAGLSLSEVFGRPVRDVEELKRPAWLALPLLVFAASIAAATLYLLRLVIGDAIERLVEDREAMGAVRGVSRVLVILVVSIAAPVVEELVFRGMLLRRLAASRGPWFGIVVSALIFGVLHPLMPVGAAALGLVYGVVLVATNALWLTVFMHAVHNSIIAVLAFGGEGMSVGARDAETSLTPGAAAILTMLMFAALFGAIVWRGLRPYLEAMTGRTMDRDPDAAGEA